MARTIEEIVNEMLTAKANETALSELNSTSNTAIWRLFIYIVAYSIWTLEILFDLFKIDVEKRIAESRIHTKNWYREKALGFLFGLPVIPGTDKFNTSGYTDDQLAAAKVIKQAACVKLISSNGYGILRVKVAAVDGSGELVSVPLLQFNSLKQYMLRHVVDAGTQVKITTGEGDLLKLIIDVYYDPLVFSPTGERLDGTAETPVLNEIRKFLKSIEFNGMLIVSDLQTQLRKVDGVKTVKIKEASSKYGSYEYDTNDVVGVGLIDEVRVADSGYMKLDESVIVINYKLIDE